MGLRVLLDETGPLFAIDLDRLFARCAPLEVELGSGRGDFIIAHAAAHPERNFLAVELAASVARVLAVRVARAGLTNVRVARMDARTLVNLMLPAHSVAACHIYFPDPWPALSQQKHRLFSPGFVRRLAKVLAPEAMLYVATDFEPYAAEIFALLEGAGFRRTWVAAPGATDSGFARKYLAEGRRIFSGAFLPPARAA